jgi:hypothetical protein
VEADAHLSASVARGAGGGQWGRAWPGGNGKASDCGRKDTPWKAQAILFKGLTISVDFC